MRNFQILAQGLNVTPLLAAISRRPEIWKEDTYLRDYTQGPFGEVDSIILRFPPRSVHDTEEALAKHNETFDKFECGDQPIFAQLPEARPLIFGTMSLLQGERLGRVIINRIKPGGVIFPHADTDHNAGYYGRYHIVIKSQPGVVFRCDQDKVYMAPGELWWFNNGLEHEVLNNSGDDRIHMVMDIRGSK